MRNIMEINDASVAGGIVRAREVFKGGAKPCGEWGGDAFPLKKCPGKQPLYQPQLLWSDIVNYRL